MKINTDNIEDVCDGELYKSLSRPSEMLHDCKNFAYIWNTDSCQAGGASKMTVWPVYLKINELPIKMRNSNLIMAGIWVNNEKPTMNTFLQPLVDEFNILSSVGVEWKKKCRNNRIKNNSIGL